MPSRENKARRESGAPSQPHREGLIEQPVKKLQGQRLSPERTHTRINAFITSMGRRNQAKRDSR